MRRHIAAILCVTLLFTGISEAATRGVIRVLPGRTTHYTTAKGSEIRHYQIPKITVMKPASFDLIFDGVGATTQGVVQEHSYSAAINASYFGRHQDGTFFPAGVRFDNGFLVSEQTVPQKDINLQVLGYYNNGTLTFSDNNSTNLTSLTPNTPGTYFNAGPWLVKGGKINPDIVRSRSHRQSQTYRTAILQRANGDIYFLVSTQKIDLPQFIVFVYKAKLVDTNEKFNLVNLDGGSSTSLRSPKLKFNSSKKLPLFIGIE